MELKFHVPLQQYGFLEFTADSTAEGDLQAAEAMYNRYAEKPMEFRSGCDARAGREITTFTGEKLWYDAVAHRYTTLEGAPLLSGTAYAKRFEQPFDRERLLDMTAKKLGADKKDVAAAWDLRGDLGKTFGSALHLAMECYFKYNHLGYGVPKHPILKAAVEAFPLKESKILSELMVVDLERGLCGQIDGLQTLGAKEGVVLDFKSDADIKKNLTKHFAQMCFYAHILMAHGWTIHYVEVWNYTGEWTSYKSEVLPLDLTSTR